MQIKDRIRQKRKELGYTQEQVAARLGVTAPAVNKWESGMTYPDITLLPPLARLLKTDLNTLLCFRETLTKEDIASILNEIAKTATKNKSDGIEKAFLMIQEKAREYPGHGELLYQLATVLRGLTLMIPCEKNLYEKYGDYARRLYEQAADSTDVLYANRAKYALASEKIQNNDFDGANALIAALPDYESLDKRLLLISLYMKQNKNGEASQLLEQKLSASIQEVFLMLDQLATAAVRENDSRRAWELADYAQKIMGVYNWEYSAQSVAMSVAVEERDAEKCFRILEAMLASLSKPCLLADSILFTHIKKNPLPVDFSQNLRNTLLEALEKEEKFAFLRDKKEYFDLLSKYM